MSGCHSTDQHQRSHVTILRLLLIIALAVGQPLMAGHSLSLHDGMAHTHHHSAQAAAGHQQDISADACGDGSPHAACAACCVAAAIQQHALSTPAVPAAPAESAQWALIEPDLATATEPPRS